MTALLSKLAQVADSNASVLITGRERHRQGSSGARASAS